MAIRRQSTLIHWNYFLALEEDLDRLARFVDLSGNDNAFSIEIARVFLACCAEIDVVLKQLCEQLKPSSKADTINAYFPIITGGIRTFCSFEVIVPRFGLSLHPWIDWRQSQPPLWWRDHNKVKHKRHDHFDRANLKNCVNSIAGLYVSILYLYRHQAVSGDLQQLPRLLNVSDTHFGGTTIGRFGHSFAYRL